MSLKSVKITGENGDYFLLKDLEGYEGKVKKSLIDEKVYRYVNGNIGITRTLYKECFNRINEGWLEDGKRKKRENQKIEKTSNKNYANKYIIQFDYPLNKEGQGVSIELFSEDHNTAQEQALFIYKKQFGKDATGNIIKVFRYRWAEEIKLFCIKKYGDAFPAVIDCGQISWLDVPHFSMSYSPMRMTKIPYFYVSSNKSKQYYNETAPIYKMLAEHEKIYVNEQKWYNEKFELLKKIMLVNNRQLSPKQLELLGINFNIYDFKYQGDPEYPELTDSEKLSQSTTI